MYDCDVYRPRETLDTAEKEHTTGALPCTTTTVRYVRSINNLHTNRFFSSQMFSTGEQRGRRWKQTQGSSKRDID